MPDISVISTSVEQLKSIVTALRFFSPQDKSRFKLHYLSTQETNLMDIASQAELQLFPAASMQDIFTKLLAAKDWLIFLSVANYDEYCSCNNLEPLTLCVHPDIALLIADDIKSYQSVYYHPVYLAENQQPADPACKTYLNFSKYMSQRLEAELLVTNNRNLVQALTMADAFNWDIHHPLHHAISIDFGNNLSDPAQIRYRLNQAQLFADHCDPHHPETIKLVREQCAHSYSFFAANYDEYMSHVAYDTWVNKIKLWFRQYTNRELAKIIELACGTANIATRFVFEGFQVDACDLSAEMLTIADAKPFKPNLYQACLTDPIPGRDYDLALCMFDSVNYLTKSKQIATMLQEVYTALAEGGIFIFDISTLFNSEENFADICSLTHTHGNYMVHQAWFEPTRYRQNSALTAFTKGFLGYSHRYEQHNQRVYLCTDLINLIHKSKLKLKAIHSSDSKVNYYPKHIGAIDDNYARLFFVLKKETH